MVWVDNVRKLDEKRKPSEIAPIVMTSLWRLEQMADTRYNEERVDVVVNWDVCAPYK